MVFYWCKLAEYKCLWCHPTDLSGKKASLDTLFPTPYWWGHRFIWAIWWKRKWTKAHLEIGKLWPRFSDLWSWHALGLGIFSSLLSIHLVVVEHPLYLGVIFVILLHFSIHLFSVGNTLGFCGGKGMSLSITSGARCLILPHVGWAVSL